MVDVARVAGVSHQTVSRVIQGGRHVSAPTRVRVEQAIAELGYRPNPVAKALVTGRSSTLGVVTFDTTLYGPTSTLLGLERAAHDAGYAVSITTLDGSGAAALLRAVDRLWDQSVAAIAVIAPVESTQEALQQLRVDLPVVAVEAGVDGQVSAVCVDQRQGAARATRYLLSLGHRTVWHIAGPNDWLEARQRAAGWQAALSEAGRPEPAQVTGDWSPRSGYDVGRSLALDPDVTAVFAANDQMALGFLRALHEAGRVVPDEVSVVGFDDIPESPFFTPPLTTVRQDFTEVGRVAVRLLVERLSGDPSPPARAVIPAELIVRDSAGRPPG